MEAQREEYNGYTYDRLRDLCRRAGIETDGKRKEELIDLLCQVPKDPLETARSLTSEKSAMMGPILHMMEMMQKQMVLQEERQIKQEETIQKQMLLQQDAIQEQMNRQRDQQDLILSIVEKSTKPKEEATKPRLPKPTLQKMSEGENVENFLEMFEKVATQQQWPKDVWSTQLAGLLTGKALAAFANLPKEKTDYESAKTAILRRYDVNAETYRQRFRNSKRRGDESFRELADRSLDLYKKWKESSEMNVDEMVLLEQFLQSVPEDLRVWLKERKPTSLDKAAELADDYVLARKAEMKANTFRHRKPNSLDQVSQYTQVRREYPLVDQNNDRRVKTESSNSTSPTDGHLQRNRTNAKGEKQCYHCKKWGHLMFSCPEREKNVNTESATSKPTSGSYFSKACTDIAWNTESHKYLGRGKVDGRPVRMLVDTGCDRTMVRASIVQESKWDVEDKAKVLCVHGDTVSYPSAMVNIEKDGVVTPMKVTLAPELPSGLDVLIGRDLLLQTEVEKSEETCLPVVTRAQARKQEEEEYKKQKTIVSDAESKQSIKHDTGEIDIKERVGDDNQKVESPKPGPQESTLDPCCVGPETVVKWQQEDPTLEKARELASRDSPAKDENGERVFFYYKDGMLYRSWSPKGDNAGDLRQCTQLVLPQQARTTVLNLAHDVPTAGHLGITKTKDRVLQRYYWPGVFKDIAEYCRTCETCQRCQPRGTQFKAKMIPMPLISKPFQRIAMDIVGPLDRSRSGNRFILTICDYATRYPEAIALPSTEATRIAKHLVELFSRVGIPEEILTDQGTNFMSALLQDIYQLLGIKRIRTTPYHAQTDGMVERFNSTLKSMLKKFVASNARDWDEYLPYLLFAYREAPQESTGFSPFELLYGRHVRGPLDVLRESWTGEETEEDQNAVQHITEMRKQLKETPISFILRREGCDEVPLLSTEQSSS